MWLLLIGVCIGMAKGLIPMGPTGLLVVERGLEGRRSSGMAVAIGGILVEGAYCMFAVLGMRALVENHPEAMATIRLIGAAVVLLAGLYLLLRSPGRRMSPASDTKAASRFPDLLLGISTASLNPAMLFTWSFVVALLAAHGFRFHSTAGLLFPIAVIAGTLACDAAVMVMLSRVGRRLSDRWRLYLEKGIALVLTLAGAIAWLHG